MTAVNWLIDQVEDYIGLIPIDIIEQAKEMERQQTEISDEEIEKEAKRLLWEKAQEAFILGAKWYREQLKLIDKKL
jgi:hypothetical protein